MVGVQVQFFQFPQAPLPMNILSAWPFLHPRFHHHREPGSRGHEVVINTSALEKCLRLLNSGALCLALAAAVSSCIGVSDWTPLRVINTVTLILLLAIIFAIELPLYRLPQALESCIGEYAAFIDTPLGRLLFTGYLALLLVGLSIPDPPHTFAKYGAFGVVAASVLLLSTLLESFVTWRFPDVYYRDISEDGSFATSQGNLPKESGDACSSLGSSLHGGSSGASPASSCGSPCGSPAPLV